MGLTQGLHVTALVEGVSASNCEGLEEAGQDKENSVSLSVSMHTVAHLLCE